MVPFAVVAWCGHTDASRAFADDLIAALKKHGVKHETFARDMGLSGEAPFSRQLSGAEPMNVWRLVTALMKHPQVQVSLLKLRTERVNAELITAADLALIRGAVALGKKKMARILPALVKERKVS